MTSEIKYRLGDYIITEHGGILLTWMSHIALGIQLGRYTITVDENSNIFWETIGVLNRLISGKCIIESEILFIGPEENESEGDQDRREFFARQKLQRQWERTFAWGHYGSPIACNEPEPRKLYSAI